VLLLPLIASYKLLAKKTITNPVMAIIFTAGNKIKK